MKNSIEETIKIIERKIKEAEHYLDITGLYLTLDEELRNALMNILSDYKKVLEENEELKQDRNNNYQMIALAQNEALGYMQGYEDGKKSKRSAVAYIVENQQYYILNKQIEHYKEWIEKLQKKNEELEEINNELEAEKNEAIRRYNFETIPKQKVKDKIEKLKGKLEDISRRREKSKTKEEETVLWCLEIRTDERIKTLQELLDKMDQNQ